MNENKERNKNFDVHKIQKTRSMIENQKNIVGNSNS